MILRNLLFLTIIVRNLTQQQTKQQQIKNKIIKSNKFIKIFVIYCGMFLLFNNFIQMTQTQQLTEPSQQQPAISEDTKETQNPEEIQKAVCTVTAGEVKASAEAITTKQLKGVCSAAEMQSALNKLELKILQELQQLKSLLIQQLKAEPKEEPLQTTTVKEIITSKPTLHFPMTKSLPTQQKQREDEVHKFNNTLLADRDIKLFTYYWKLENFSQHIGQVEMHELESPVFNIKGKPLQIKAHFQHFQRDFLFLQLQHATANVSKKNIWLEMAADPKATSLFKEIVSDDKIEFKHKISILDQHNRQTKDLVSQEFNNLDNGLLVPNSALIGTSPYIKKDALLIQLFLYL